MPFSYIKRKTRRISRRVLNWTTIAGLTLSGNKIDKNTDFKNCRNPILMIYGFGATRRTLTILESRLNKEGYTTFSLNLGGLVGTFNTSSIEETANTIDKKIERLYEKFNIKGRISIVGHSKGGLIGQYYIKFLHGSKRVRSLITIGTAHNGNPWAMLASYTPATFILKSVKQMSPASEFIKKIKAKKFPGHIKVFSIYSKDDTVAPFPTTILDEEANVKNIEVFGVTHSELLIKKNVFNAILHALKDDMPESWYKESQKDYQAHLNKKSRFKIKR